MMLFVHGWGYDASFWSPLRAALGEPRGEAVDYGYFGTAYAPHVEAPLIVAHSLGVLRMLERLPAGCRGLVAINGFDHFVGKGGVAPRILDRMIARFATHPVEVLTDFRRRCGDETNPPPLHPAPLARDLAMLRDVDTREGAVNVPLLILHGSNDPLLTHSHRSIMFAAAHAAQHFEVADGGHLLPLTHDTWCADQIRRFVRTEL